MTTKTCFTCEVEKPLSDFNRKSASKNGYLYECRACANKRPSKKRKPYSCGNNGTHVRPIHPVSGAIDNYLFSPKAREAMKMCGPPRQRT